MTQTSHQAIKGRSWPDGLIWAIFLMSALFAIVALIQAVVVWAAFLLGVVPLGPDSGDGLSAVLDYFPAVVLLLALFWSGVFWTALNLKWRRLWAKNLMTVLLAAGSVIAAIFAVALVFDQGFVTALGASVWGFVIAGAMLSVFLGAVAEGLRRVDFSES